MTLSKTIPQFNEHFEGGVADYYFNLHLDTGGSTPCFESVEYAHAPILTSIEYHVRFPGFMLSNLGRCSVAHVRLTFISWILGYGYCCAEVSKDATGHPTEISLTDWRFLPRMHYALIPDPVGWEVRSPPQNLVQPFPPHVMYHDRRIACELCARTPLY